jgi:DNA-binding CsgD family transcriptional regulator
MKRWETMVYARFLSGMHPKIIAGCLGVSEETVRVRLRAAGFFVKDLKVS